MGQHASVWVIARCYLDVCRSKVPLQCPAQGWHIHALWDVYALCQLIDVLQGTLDTIKNAPQDPWPQFYRQWFTCAEHRIANSHT